MQSLNNLSTLLRAQVKTSYVNKILEITSLILVSIKICGGLIPHMHAPDVSANNPVDAFLFLPTSTPTSVWLPRCIERQPLLLFSTYRYLQDHPRINGTHRPKHNKNHSATMAFESSTASTPSTLSCVTT